MDRGEGALLSFLVDTNLLVYASVPAMDEHETARAWLVALFADDDRFVGIAWSSLLALVRIVSNRHIMREAAVDLRTAWEGADRYRRQRTARLLQPGPNHHQLFDRLIGTPGLSSNDVPDVHLAALAIEHGVVLATHDHGFGRFDGLRWEDPLRPKGGMHHP